MSHKNPSPLGPPLLAFLAGSAAGALLAALLTPRRGPALRAELARRAKRTAEGLGQDAADVWGGLKALTGQAVAEFRRAGGAQPRP